MDEKDEKAEEVDHVEVKNKEVKETDDKPKAEKKARAKRASKKQKDDEERKDDKEEKEENGDQEQKGDQEVKEKDKKAVPKQRAKRQPKTPAQESSHAEDAAPKSKRPRKTADQKVEDKKEKGKGGKDEAPPKIEKDQKAKIEKDDKGKDNLDKPKSKTWAGRWIPTDAHQYVRMMAIKQVFESRISTKVRTASSLQSPFFTHCMRAFKNKDMELTTTVHDEWVDAAELEVAAFLQSDSARALMCLTNLFQPVFSRFSTGILGEQLDIKRNSTNTK